MLAMYDKWLIYLISFFSMNALKRQSDNQRITYEEMLNLSQNKEM